MNHFCLYCNRKISENALDEEYDVVYDSSERGYFCCPECQDDYYMDEYEDEDDDFDDGLDYDWDDPDDFDDDDYEDDRPY